MSAFAERVLANVREEIRAEVAYALELAGEPELLEALKRCLSALDGLMGDTDPLQETPALHACQQASAAIAKATQP